MPRVTKHAFDLARQFIMADITRELQLAAAASNNDAGQSALNAAGVSLLLDASGRVAA